MLAPDKFTNVFIIGKASLICCLIIYHHLYENVRMIQKLFIVCSGAKESQGMTDNNNETFLPEHFQPF